VKYGGNTLCLELRFKGLDRRIIIDAGSGIRELGDFIMDSSPARGSIQSEIFLSHTHWDHIMGFPFFAPIHSPRTKLKIYGPVTYEDDTLEEIVGGQLAYRYFPVRLQELAAEMEYINLMEGSLDLGDGIILRTKYLNHSILCLGYRFEYQGQAICTAFDTEPFQNIFSADQNGLIYDEAMVQEGHEAALEENQRVLDFFTGAGLLIHDAQYTLNEYESAKKGWGHSTFEYAVNAASEAKVKRLALIHHDPLRTDAQIDTLSKVYCDQKYSNDLEVFFAREGTTVEI